MADTPQPQTINYVLPVVSAFLGFAFSSILDWGRDARTYKREKAAREAARRDAILERRNEFQRETLLSLQEAVLRLMQTSAKLHLLYLDNLKTHGTGYATDAPAELAKDNQDANGLTAMLSSRVRDEEVRTLLQTLKNYLNAAVSPSNRSIEVSRAAWTQVTQNAVALNLRIGDALRSLDDVELSSLP